MSYIIEAHNRIVREWNTGKEMTVYNVVDVNKDGTVTIQVDIISRTFNPNGSEESPRKFLQIYFNPKK